MSAPSPAPMRHFCTYFDSHFLARGLALYESLVQHAGEFTLHILCFDNTSYRFFEQHRLKHVIPISLDDFEKADPELAGCKGGRSRVEYMFTCSPSLPTYVLGLHPDVDAITYLDADLYFFSSPEPIFRELGDGSILIIGHRFSERNRERERFGKYNVGLLSFRNNKSGRDCLSWWRKKCIQWCFDREEEGRFADQKYLDRWPELFEGVHVLRHKGANLAPWNIDNFSYRQRGAVLLVDEDELIFYHFHQFGSLSHSLYHTGVACEQLPSRVLELAYGPYVSRLRSICERYGLDEIGRSRYSTGNRLLEALRRARSEELIYCRGGLPPLRIGRLLRLPSEIYWRVGRVIGH